MDVHESVLTLDDGRAVTVFDSAPGDAGRRPVYWHHGSPGVGLPPAAPLAGVTDELGLRWVGHTRPGYVGSTPLPGRDVASVAADVAQVADALGLERFATLGHSGGGAHALAVGALLGDRVTATVAVSGLAPYVAHQPERDFDWFAGFAPSAAAELRAAAAGREALEAHLASAGDDVPFTEGDVDALRTDWGWFMEAVGPATAVGPAGFVDDDLASVGPWGFAPSAVTSPTLFVHGEADEMVPAGHSRWNAAQVPGAQLWLRAGEGHLTIMRHVADALRWLP